uniref:Uncharacterized protein n=1 Tax=Ditylenchus dipsaci TaxID=166011 RepID=A0A915E333_9BILA
MGYADRLAEKYARGDLDEHAVAKGNCGKRTKAEKVERKRNYIESEIREIAPTKAELKHHADRDGQQSSDQRGIERSNH